MTISIGAEGLVALAILAHAWHGRMQGPPALLSAIGWTINVLTVLALGAVWVRC